MAPARSNKRKATSPVASPAAAKRKASARDSTASNASVARAVGGGAVGGRALATPVLRKPELNAVPTPTAQRRALDVFVFGTGSMGELGLGPASKNKTVKRPRLNAFLAEADVIDVAVGGMHAVALLKDGRVLSWGVNDQGALGRDTAWEGGVVDADKAEDSDSDSEGLNPKESTPAPVETEVRFVAVTASDSLTAAIDVDGQLWAWGTFRCSDGILGFSATQQVATRPQRVALKDRFVALARGTDHILALTTAGRVYAWGNGQQFQLGRRVVERTRLNGLVPREFGLKNVVAIGAGAYHSFAKTMDGKVLAWGLNQFGQCGVEIKEIGEDGAVLAVPTVVDALEGIDVAYITGGEHHSAALTAQGEVYVWGRLDAFELGFPMNALPEATRKDEAGRPRYIPVPTRLPLLDDSGAPLKAKAISCGSHHNILIDERGHAWSWGFGESYQVGQGPAGEDVEVPTRIQNTATADRDMVAAGAGGQFSVICALRQQHANGDA